MNKKQQMRWNRTSVQPFLDVRTAALNNTLEEAFRHRYPGFRPSNDDHLLSEAASSPPGFCMLSSATSRAKPAATAASKALPPRSSTAMPTWLASQCVLATTPNVPAISGLVVNMRRVLLLDFSGGRIGYDRRRLKRSHVCAAGQSRQPRSEALMVVRPELAIGRAGRRR
jgi:hypothetical protein